MPMAFNGKKTAICTSVLWFYNFPYTYTLSWFIYIYFADYDGVHNHTRGIMNKKWTHHWCYKMVPVVPVSSQTQLMSNNHIFLARKLNNCDLRQIDRLQCNWSYFTKHDKILQGYFVKMLTSMIAKVYEFFWP